MKRFNRTIRQKIYLLITIVCIIPLLSVTLYSLRTFSQQVLETTQNSMLQICQSVNYNIELTLSDIKDTSNMLIANDEIQKGIENGNLSQWNLSKAIINMTTNKKFIASTVVTLPTYSAYSRTNLSAAAYGEQYANVNMSKFEEFLFQKTSLENPSIWNVWMDGSEFYISDNDCIFFSRSINSLANLKKCGAMIIGVNKTLFSNICNNELKESEFEIHILNKEQSIFSTSNDGPLTEYLQTCPVTTDWKHSVGKKDYLIYSVKNNVTGWTVYCTLPYDYLSRSQHSVFLFTLLLGCFLLAVCLLIGYFITYRITKQIYLLTTAINQLEHQEFSNLQFDLNDEIGWLGNRFQTVVAENHQLTTSLYESTIKRKEAELMMLQSQINPHFLYNTLNTLYWMTKKANAPEAAKMVLNLSRFFELSLNHGNSVSTVRQELDLVRYYFEIQNVRFNNRFELIVDVPEQLLNDEILNILLQPLVENSICHGLEMLETKGIIQISARQEENYLIISVTDNGIGFPPDTDPLASGGYALVNINERLKLTYGENSRLTIKNAPSKGTIVTVYIYKPASI